MIVKFFRKPIPIHDTPSLCMYGVEIAVHKHATVFISLMLTHHISFPSPDAIHIQFLSSGGVGHDNDAFGWPDSSRHHHGGVGLFLR